MKIGPYCFASVASDDAGNCNKGRRLLADDFPHIFDLADACHNLHNCCKDICALEEFKPVIVTLRALLAFMIMATYTLDFYDLAQEELGIKHGLQSIGETRFATIYWSIQSVLEGFPAFQKIVNERSQTGIGGEVTFTFMISREY